MSDRPLSHSVDTVPSPRDHVPPGFDPVSGVPEPSEVARSDEGTRRPPRYALRGEVDRGAMGVVYRAHDRQLDREVAVKVLLDAQGADRFVVESRVTARLPHPGIPPVYSLGHLRDGRLFLAMKLVRGRTLKGEIERAGPDDRPRLLEAFARICEAVGFAHSRGIIHRDLKPANVMVGDFGEVYVMDWGLAKVAGAGADEPGLAALAAAPVPDETVAGAVKGTPAYMAPEQARGEPVDARADVFALGGILAAVLTGQAPFGGTTAMDTVLQAAQAELDGCFARLDACRADPELVALARWCLSASASARPADGNAVAAAVAAYRAAVDDRLRAAERERAAAAVKVQEGRKRRRVQAALAAAVLLLAAGTAGFLVWRQDQRLAAERAEAERLRLDGARGAAVARADAEAEVKREQARQGIAAALRLAADLRDQYKFRPAEAALAQAAELARGAPERAADVEQAQRDLAFVAQLDGIRYRKWVWVAEEGGKGRFNKQAAPQEYRKAFADHGLDPTALAPAEAARRVAASAVRRQLVLALDDWALFEPDRGVRDRLLDVARRADPGPWLDRLRDPDTRAVPAAVEGLRRDADLATAPAAALGLLARLMERRGLDPAPLLAEARARHPTDFDLAFALGQWYGRDPKGGGRQIGPYEAARALRPDNVAVLTNLGYALQDQGQHDEAIAIYEAAIGYDPRAVYAYNNLGAARKAKGDRDGAITAWVRAAEIDPGYVDAQYSLGRALQDRAKPGDLKQAIAAFEAVVAADPKHDRAYYRLGVVRKEWGNLDGAAEAFKAVTRLKPDNARAHADLGAVYYIQKRYKEVIEPASEAIRLDPELANAHAMLGMSYLKLGEPQKAREPLTTAAKLNPKEYGPLLKNLPPLPGTPPPRPR